MDLIGNSQQTLITAETSPYSSELPARQGASGKAVSWYVAARIGLEGRVPIFALLQRDPPFIFAEIVTAIGPDGRDTDSKIRLSVDKTWHPDGGDGLSGAVVGFTHFNEIRIYRRDYFDLERRYRLARPVFFIAGQLSGFLQSGSSIWPGASPLPEVR